MAHLVRPSYVYFADANGARVPKGTPGAKKHRRKATKWYGQGIPGLPPKKRVPLASNKQVAKSMLQDLVEKSERRRGNLPDLDAINRPIAEHLAEYESHLREKPDRGTDLEIESKAARIRRIIDGCGFAFPAEIDAGKVAKFLDGLRKPAREIAALPKKQDTFTRAELASIFGIQPNSVTTLLRRHGLAEAAEGNGKARVYPRAVAEALHARLGRGTSVQTANHYLASMKAFCRWLVEEDRLDRNPLAKLKPGNAELDRRHDRRALTVVELTSILEAARRSERTIRGLDGPARFALYLTACATGFRAQELAALTPAMFNLDADPPTVSLPAREGKNRRRSVQPIRHAAVAELRAFVEGKPRLAPLWPGSWCERSAEMLREDLDAAGVAYAIEGLDGPLFADFHALRHTFITMLGKAGVTIKEAQVLARHSDPKLTIGRYSHASLPELGLAVNKLPDVGAATLVPVPDREQTRDALAAIGLILWHALLGGIRD